MAFRTELQIYIRIKVLDNDCELGVHPGPLVVTCCCCSDELWRCSVSHWLSYAVITSLCRFPPLSSCSGVTTTQPLLNELDWGEEEYSEEKFWNWKFLAAPDALKSAPTRKKYYQKLFHMSDISTVKWIIYVQNTSIGQWLVIAYVFLCCCYHQRNSARKLSEKLSV